MVQKQQCLVVPSPVRDVSEFDEACGAPGL